MLWLAARPSIFAYGQSDEADEQYLIKVLRLANGKGVRLAFV